MAEPKLSPLAKSFLETREGLGSLPFQTDMNAVRARQAELADFLGTSDYASRMEEANNLAKFQVALAMAQRGFAGMGATPKRGQSGFGALASNVFAPLAGDIATVAGPLMQQRAAAKAAQEQEERQIKLAALSQVQAEEAAKQTVTLALMPKPVTPKLGLDPYVVVSLDEGGIPSLVKKPGGTAAIQVRQGNIGGKPTITDITTGLPHALGANQQIMKFSEFAKKAGAGGGANVGYMRNKTTKRYEHVARGAPGEPARFSLSGEDITDPDNWTWVGSTIPTADETTKPTLANLPKLVQKWIKNKDGKLVLDPTSHYAVRKTVGGKTTVIIPDLDQDIIIGSKVDQWKIIDPEGAGITEADRSRVDRRNLLLSFMNQYQDLQLSAPNSAYSARSALFFDQSAYLAGKSPWRYIPPGTLPQDRTQDVIITNTDVLKLIETKMDSVAQQFLKREFGDASTETKSSMLAKAVKGMLSLPPETIFGASPIEVIGERGGQPVGYSPTAAAFSPAAIAENIRTVKTSLKEDAGANAAILYGPVAYPYNKEDLNKPWGREKVAATAFPGAFGNTGTVGTDTYDFGQDQQRRDVESVLSNVRLLADATPDEHKAVIQDAVIKKVDARDKLQNSRDARLARESFGYALEFRRALLDFKNASAHSNVEGFFTGKGAGLAARLGFADWISAEGAEHWRRLEIASERFQKGISRRVGKDFGDDRISNLDAAAYQKLVAGISNSKKYNRILVEEGLLRVGHDLTDLMEYGGKVGWTERDLKRAAEAGVDFSELSTQMDWHGYGYYGKGRYSSTRQRTPSLTDAQRSATRSKGELKDTLYRGEYTVPSVDYLTDNVPTFTQGSAASKGNLAVPPTAVNMMDPAEFEVWLGNMAETAGLFGAAPSVAERQAGIAEMRRRAVRGIRRYNIWRDNLR